MGKLKKGAWCGVWLLCALILAAALDSVPDPPALKSGTSDVRAGGVMGPLQAFAGGELRNRSRVPGPRLARRWIAFKHLFEAQLPVAEVALVRQAADPSPPNFIWS
jgi:hypothetical protein